MALNDKLPPLYVPLITLELGLAPSHWTPPGVLWTGSLPPAGRPRDTIPDFCENRDFLKIFVDFSAGIARTAVLRAAS